MTGTIYKDIVVGIDGSEESGRALLVGAGLARAGSRRIHLISVVRPPDRWWGVMGAPTPVDDVVDVMEQTTNEMLAALVAESDLGDLEVEVRVESGDPANELNDYCEKIDAGTLVVGRRGAGMVERLLLGSVADRLAHRCPVPLLIVP